MNIEKKYDYKFIDDIANGLVNVSEFFWEAVKTFIRDSITKKVPGFRLTVVSIGIILMVMFHIDFYILWRLHLPFPHTGTWFYRFYVLFAVATPYLVWALFAQARRAAFLRNLETAFLNIPLKNAMGNTPTYHSEKAIDKDVRSLLLKNPYISIEEFKKKKEQIGSAIRGRVIDIREHRGERLVEIKYADREIRGLLTVDEINQYKDFSFLIGQGYERTVKGNFLNLPHILVGGQTGGGKSTFLRGLITTLYVNNKDKIEMTLIDLKEGIEFEVFEGLPDVQVYSDISPAVNQITSLRDLLKVRGELLKSNGVKSLAELPESKRPKRCILIVDEAADIFLNGAGKSSKDISEVRESISLIARKGRASGIHLILATQKPDARAIDPHVKSCLSGALCFSMVDDASSISILGNGRATDLPPIPGRAIWKESGEQLEVQTPFMSDTEARALLSRYKTQTPKPVAAAEVPTKTDEAPSDDKAN